MPRNDLNPIQIIVLMTQLVMAKEYDEAATLAQEDGRALAQLVQMLRQTGRGACYGAACALAKVGKLALLPLLDALNDPRHPVRQAAALGLGELGYRRSVPLLISALNDQHYTVRQAAAMALGRIGDREATLPLLTKLWDESIVVRRMAAIALGEIGDERAVPDLQRMVDQDSEAEDAARMALDEIERRGNPN